MALAVTDRAVSYGDVRDCRDNSVETKYFVSEVYRSIHSCIESSEASVRQKQVDVIDNVKKWAAVFTGLANDEPRSKTVVRSSLPQKPELVPRQQKWAEPRRHLAVDIHSSASFS